MHALTADNQPPPCSRTGPAIRYSCAFYIRPRAENPTYWWLIPSPFCLMLNGVVSTTLGGRSPRCSSNSMSQFRVRQAELRDLPRVTTVGLASLPDDPAFVWLYRYRHQYPDDNYFFWLQVFKTYLYTPNITFLVAEEVASLDKKSEDRGEAVATIFAFAIWERNEKKTATQALTSLYNNCSLETIHREHSCVNPDLDAAE